MLNLIPDLQGWYHGASSTSVAGIFLNCVLFFVVVVFLRGGIISLSLSFLSPSLWVYAHALERERERERKRESSSRL